MRISVAVEVEIPDGTDPSALVVTSVTLTGPIPVGRRGKTIRRPITPAPERYEIHPDPSAVFGDDQ